MVEITTTGAALDAAVERFRRADFPLAFTGAGISVPSGIPDFRSRGGLWTKYNPAEFATIDVFHKDPEKTWSLYRGIGRDLRGKKPNKAHLALAEMEKAGLLRGVVTQNIDSLHTRAGSETVFEIHGDYDHLQCLTCGNLEEVTESLLEQRPWPRCDHCDSPLKPNIVLFGEGVRQLEAIQTVVMQCDLMLVIGTSANVFPAAALPMQVKENGGLLYEFNLEPVLERADYCFTGSVEKSLPLLAEALG